MAEAQEKYRDNLQWQQRWAQVVAKAWLDEGFKARLLAEPAVVLAAEGLVVPSGVELKVFEDTVQLIHLTLPTRPDSAEISDERLNAVVEGEPCVTSPCGLSTCPCGSKSSIQ